MTPEQLAEIERGLEGVTPGPWHALRSDPAEGVNCWWVNGQPSPMLRGFSATVATVGGGYGLNDNRETAAHLARCDPQTIAELVRLARIGMTAEKRDFFDLRAFSRENLARCEAPNGFRHPLNAWSLAEWLTATAGELGEAAGAIKEILRARDGVPGKGQTPEQQKQNLADEIADTAIYLDLLSQAAGIDLAHAIRSKFDRTSAKVGYTLPAPDGGGNG